MKLSMNNVTRSPPTTSNRSSVYPWLQYLVAGGTARLDGVSEVSLAVDDTMLVVVAVGKIYEQLVTLGTHEAGRVPHHALPSSHLASHHTQLTDVYVTLTLVTRL